MDLYKQLANCPRPLSRLQFRLWHLFALMTVAGVIFGYVAMKRRAAESLEFKPTITVSTYVDQNHLWHVYSCHPANRVDLCFHYLADDRKLDAVDVGSSQVQFVSSEAPLGITITLRENDMVHPIPDDVNQLFDEIQKLVAKHADVNELAPFDADYARDPLRRRNEPRPKRPQVFSAALPPDLVKSLVDICEELLVPSVPVQSISTPRK